MCQAPMNALHLFSRIPSRRPEGGAREEVRDLGCSLWPWELLGGHGKGHGAKKRMRSESPVTSPLQ